MTFASFKVRAISLLGVLGLSLTLCCDTAYSQTEDASVPAQELSVPEPNLEDQLIKSLLRIRQLEGELRSAEEKLGVLSAQQKSETNGADGNQFEFGARNGREELCVQSVMQALRDESASIDWKLSCGEKLISEILASAESQESPTVSKQNTTAITVSDGNDPGNDGRGAETLPGGAAQQNSELATSTEPYVIVSGDDGETPLMLQQRDVARMKMELLPSTECIEAGKWLVDAAKDDLLLFSFFAVDRGQIGRCVQANSGWRFERAGPFDEGYVLLMSRRS
jgi:hypothetical protein